MGRIEQSIKEYRDKYESREDGKCAFFLKDIKELSAFVENERDGSMSLEETVSFLFEAIYNALAAGFVIGCHYKEQEKGRAKIS